MVPVMFITYLIVSLLLGLFMTYSWSSNGFANTCIKVVFTLYTIWTAFMLLGVAWSHIVSALPNLRMF